MTTPASAPATQPASASALADAQRLLLGTPPRRGWFAAAPFWQVLPETLLLVLLLQAAAWLASRSVVAPWPELLAFAAEHLLWLYPALRLRPAWGAGSKAAIWRWLRLPLLGVLSAWGFVLAASWLLRLAAPGRALFEFQTLVTAQDPPRLLSGLSLLGPFLLTHSLRLIFAYSYRALWLEGERQLRWRLTALALSAGVLASALVTVSPSLLSLLADPARSATGSALRETRESASALQPALDIGEEQLRRAFNSRESQRGRERLERLDIGNEFDLRRGAGDAGRVVVLLTISGQVFSSTNSDRFFPGVSVAGQSPDPWREAREAAQSGRCRTSIFGSEVFAACPLFDGSDQPAYLVGIIRDLPQGGVPFADVVATLGRDLTLVLDRLSSAFAPILLALGFFAYLTARRLTERLDNLVDTTEALSSGALYRRAQSQGQDELALLSARFNGMAEHLEANIAALAREKAQVEALLRANRTLTASASHELRTPLAIMRAHLEASELRQELLGAREQAILAQEVERLERLVEDLFALSRLELGRLTLEPSPSDVSEVLRRLAKSLSPLTERRKIQLVERLASDLPLVALDPGRLQQVLLNLLHNALRYTPEGGLILLESGLERRGARQLVYVAVADTGIGMSQAELEQAFEPFYRSPEAKSHDQSGAGLGLALVQHLVAAMGGEIEAESIEGQGSRFMVYWHIS
jgi:signal transduction histidine kinase